MIYTVPYTVGYTCSIHTPATEHTQRTNERRVFWPTNVLIQNARELRDCIAQYVQIVCPTMYCTSIYFTSTLLVHVHGRCTYESSTFHEEQSNSSRSPVFQFCNLQITVSVQVFRCSGRKDITVRVQYRTCIEYAVTTRMYLICSLSHGYCIPRYIPVDLLLALPYWIPGRYIGSLNSGAIKSAI